jgi:hypothetical protein
VKPTSTVVIGGKPVDRTNFAVLGFSAEGKASAPLVLAGYGIVAPEHKIDDYARPGREGQGGAGPALRARGRAHG